MSEPFFVTYNEQKLNIATFLSKHPGGSEILQDLKDKDITKEFDEINHSEEAKQLMQKYLVEDKNKSTTANNNQQQLERGKKNNSLNLKFVVEKLFTKEDKNYIHKTFGFLSLLSFAYRYLYFIKNGTLGFDGTAFDYFTLFIHFMLSFSSLIFHVLEKRLASNPLIIYEEYRLHAIVFTARALGVSLFGMSTFIQNLSPTVRQILLICFILSIHLTVDYITLKHGTEGITAVRNDDGKKLRNLKLFFAYYQFLALGSHLVLDDKLCDLGFNTAIAIQSSAFLMTLKRKGIIRWYSHLFWYSLALALSISYMMYVKGALFFLYISVFFYMRVEYNLSKYLVWSQFLFAYLFFDLYQFQSQFSTNVLSNFNFFS